jgi:hypothetical protein
LSFGHIDVAEVQVIKKEDEYTGSDSPHEFNIKPSEQKRIIIDPLPDSSPE